MRAGLVTPRRDNDRITNLEPALCVAFGNADLFVQNVARRSLRNYPAGLNRFSRRLFATTLIELNAIAALAITGFKYPSAAAGMAITL